MKRKAASGIMLTLLTISTLTLAFGIQRVRADWTWTETIYIRADGSVYPNTAPILSADNITYTLTDNIVGDVPAPAPAIAVERGNVVIDGAGYAVQGTGEGTGIDIRWATNVTIKNTIVSNFTYGIYLIFTSNNTITGNTILSSRDSGICLMYASNNSIIDNAATDNYMGIFLYYSSSNTLTGNAASSNSLAGIVLGSSGSSILAGNTLVDNLYNFYVSGSVFPDFNNNIDTSNTVDGKPIYYVVDMADAVYDAQTNAGAIFLINCNEVTIRDLTLAKNECGVFFWNTTRSTIENVTASNNHNGISLKDSSNNVLTGNTISNNSGGAIVLGNSSNNAFACNTVSNNSIGFSFLDSSNNVLTGNAVSDGITGIGLVSSSNNIIFHNSFTENWLEVSSRPGCINSWDDGYPSGGNYWSDYAGGDLYSGPSQDQPGSDGIGDTPYPITFDNQDNYPLMEPWTPTPPAILANFEIDPDTLNLRSKGQWITAYIQLPEDHNPADIDASTVLLNGTIAPVLDPKYDFVTDSSEYLVDHDNDGVLERMIKFDRASLASWIYQSARMQHEVALTITGALTDGTPFEGTATIFVVYSGGGSGRRK